MSEYINSQTQRRETLKRMIRELHEGKAVDEVKAEFAALLGDVSASEIAAMEQSTLGGMEGVVMEEVLVKQRIR